jgi:ATP-dependent DNA helicase PIF1
LSRNIPAGPEFDNAIRIYTTKDKVKIANEESLIKNNRPVALIRSINTPDAAINKEKDDEMHIGAYELTLSIGCKVMLRTNLWVEGGLFNGSVGIVRAILFSQVPPSLPLYVLVEFEKYNGPTLGETGCIPIVPISRSWVNSENLTMTRTQLPLSLAYALTVHKAQGLTLDKAIIDFGPKEFAHGLSYVALSRVRKISDLIIEGSFTKDRFDSISRSKPHRDLKRFLETFRSHATVFE